MGKFIFKKNEVLKPLIIEIEEKSYECFPESIKVKFACDKFAKEILPLQKEVGKPDLTQENLNTCLDRVYLLISDTINQILGQGVYNEIFANRLVDFLEHQELICFIIDEIKTFYEKEKVVLNEYSD